MGCYSTLALGSTALGVLAGCTMAAYGVYTIFRPERMAKGIKANAFTKGPQYPKWLAGLPDNRESLLRFSRLLGGLGVVIGVCWVIMSIHGPALF